MNHTPESHHLGIFGQQKLATMGKNGYRIGWEGRSGKSGKSWERGWIWSKHASCNSQRIKIVKRYTS